MSTPLVAYFGDHDSPSQLARLAAAHDAAVVAVVLDIGQDPPLGGLKEEALSAGAVRCHALDVRDDFVRSVILTAARIGDDEARTAAVPRLAAAYVFDVLRRIAALERGQVAPLDSAIHLRRRLRPVAGARVSLSLRFENGEPVALNGVALTPGELVDSLETISGIAALDVLHLAYRELAGASHGVVDLAVVDGICSRHAAATALS
jgi:argininosuccinate synthase